MLVDDLILLSLGLPRFSWPGRILSRRCRPARSLRQGVPWHLPRKSRLQMSENV